ncbi:hydroxyectoine utilization dehydratase EutB [Caenispirillum salinarum]|uniref:hydroxyectoine utilization dehydratase EutB n=1 Tax=Caenispirillum salinarum TaxID=859058 RepID=UPI00384E88EE
MAGTADTLNTLDAAAIGAARARIAPLVRRTPQVPSQGLGDVAGVPVDLKLEQLQDSGAFKLRGASNLLATLPRESLARGVVAVSTGNHGRAVALAARRMGVRAVVCMSALVPSNKVDAIRALGAEARIVGRSQDEADEEARRLVAEEGMAYAAPFDDPAIIAGQGTIGLELLEDAPDLAAVLVPLSGGGLFAGVALAIKAQRPDVKLIGISMERGAAMHASLAAGRPVAVEELPTLADSLGGGVGLKNRHTFALTRELIDDVILLTEAEIAAGMRWLYRHEQLVTEGAAAVGAAAILAGRTGRLPGRTAALVTGRNVDMDTFTRIVSAPSAEAAVQGARIMEAA